MSSKQTQLLRARQRVRSLKKELDDYMAKQHSVSSGVLENDRKYRELNAQLLRAKAVVRSLTRGLKDL